MTTDRAIGGAGDGEGSVVGIQRRATPRAPSRPAAWVWTPILGAMARSSGDHPFLGERWVRSSAIRVRGVCLRLRGEAASDSFSSTVISRDGPPAGVAGTAGANPSCSAGSGWRKWLRLVREMRIGPARPPVNAKGSQGLVRQNQQRECP